MNFAAHKTKTEPNRLDSDGGPDFVLYSFKCTNSIQRIQLFIILADLVEYFEELHFRFSAHERKFMDASKRNEIENNRRKFELILFRRTIY